jgi:hypothetical protein
MIGEYVQKAGGEEQNDLHSRLCGHAADIDEVK